MILRKEVLLNALYNTHSPRVGKSLRKFELKANVYRELLEEEECFVISGGKLIAAEFSTANDACYVAVTSAR